MSTKREEGIFTKERSGHVNILPLRSGPLTHHHLSAKITAHNQSSLQTCTVQYGSH